MSQAGVELVREMYSAFHGGDAERALSYFDDDVAIDATASVDGGAGRGREALARIIGRWLAGFEDWHEEIEEIHERGDLVCAVAVQHGRGPDSGIELRARYAVLYEVTDGAIASMTLYRDPADALRAAGIEGEGPAPEA